MSIKLKIHTKNLKDNKEIRNSNWKFILRDIYYKSEIYSEYLKKIDEFLIDKESKINTFLQEYNINTIDLNLIESESEILSETKIIFLELLLIQLIAFVELELKKICNSCYSNNSLEYEFFELKGNSDFDKTKLFLTKSCGINFGVIKEWDFIWEAKKIRNKIVHNKDELKELEKQKIQQSFIKELINKINIFFEKIIIELDKKYVRKNRKN